ncbi:MAG: RNA methyltransferase [Victivallaceae bacterium]|nr:RNA methyltransferase [Victivallaceae bacterium]
MQALTRREKSLLRALLTRGGRKRAGLCRCEGLRAVREFLTERPELVEFTVGTERGLASLGEVAPISFRLTTEEEFSGFSATVNHQGILAVGRIPPFSETAPQGDFILALDGLADPGNFGTVARTFRAIGGHDVWYTDGSVDPWGDKAIRSGLGAQFSLRFRRFAALADLGKQAAEYGYRTLFVADPHEGEVCFDCGDLFRKTVLVIGGEANGASTPPPGSRKVVIPMPGDYESLNAAQAATVLLLEYVRRNRGGVKC